MREFDLHGMRWDEAETLFHKLLGEIRSERKMESVLFITGVGVLQGKLRELAHSLGLETEVPTNNTGRIIIHFE